MAAGVGYSANSNIVFRFYNHAVLGLKPEIQEHDRNIIEKAGDAGVYVLENLPSLVGKLARDPKVVTIAATSFALLADSYLFYPDETEFYIRATIALLPQIPFWAWKFGLWSGSVETITSYGTRALGRFTNSELMNRFYGVDPAEAAEPARRGRGRRGVEDAHAD